MDTQGVLYIVFGSRYEDEAIKSIQSLRKVNTAIQFAVVCEKKWEGHFQPDHYILRPPIYSLGSAPEYILETPFHRTLYVDSDTIFTEDISRIFEFLDLYDVGVFSDGPMLREKGGLFFVPQCNGGVILFKKNEFVAKMFAEWRQNYLAAKEQLAKEKTSREKKGPRNQRILTRVLAEAVNVRVGQLPSCLNLTTWRTVKLYNRPRIWHTRLNNPDVHHKTITHKWGEESDVRERIWLPHINGFLPWLGVLRRDWLLYASFRLRRLLNRYVQQ